MLLASRLFALLLKFRPFRQCKCFNTNTIFPVATFIEKPYWPPCLNSTTSFSSVSKQYLTVPLELRFLMLNWGNRNFCNIRERQSDPFAECSAPALHSINFSLFLIRPWVSILSRLEESQSVVYCWWWYMVYRFICLFLFHPTSRHGFYPDPFFYFYFFCESRIEPAHNCSCFHHV